MSSGTLLEQLPKIRGQYKKDFPLVNITWFKVGGPAEILFIPKDVEDLSKFLQKKPKGLTITVLGMCSNVIIRDGGVGGVVVRLGDGFKEITMHSSLRAKRSSPCCKLLYDAERIDCRASSKLAMTSKVVTVGCGLSNHHLVSFLKKNNLSGLEFLSGIPGTVGGAIAMNAGCCGSEVADHLISVEVVHKSTGKIYTLPAKDLCLSYRHNARMEEFIFTKASFLLKVEKDACKIKEKINEISKMKSISQPISQRTGGSMFKNPEGHIAWKLIDKAGFRGYQIGGAKVSDKHTNFLINTGNATAHDLETLGELVRAKVQKDFGVELEWEIQRVGRAI